MNENKMVSWLVGWLILFVVKGNFVFWFGAQI